MTKQEFKETKKYLLDICQEIMDAKQQIGRAHV